MSQLLREENIRLTAEVNAARATASYWKDEHLAGNKEVDRLKETVVRYDKEQSVALALAEKAEAEVIEANHRAAHFAESEQRLRDALENIACNAEGRWTLDQCKEALKGGE